MSKTSRELIEFCKGKLGTPYVFGMKGQILTEALLQQLAAENPKVYTSQSITPSHRMGQGRWRGPFLSGTGTVCVQ